MGTFGSKEYDYSYYGVPDTQNKYWYKSGDTEAFAACIYPTVYGVPGFYGSFVTDGVYYMGDNPSPKNGKPLDTSIALWHIPKTASFACNSVFSIEQSNTITAHFTSNVENTDVPIAMLATDIGSSSYGGFGAIPVDRYAYDTTSPCNGGFSRPIYDIRNYMFCLYPRITMLNTTTGSQSTVALQALANTIGNNENFEVSCIRSDLYYGMSPRTTNAGDHIPAQGAHETHLGVPTIDTLSNRPTPENESYLKTKIKDGHSDWRDDVTYSPWYQRYALLMYSTDAGSVFNRQNDIGFDRQLSASAIRNGARTIDTGHNITAQIYRCNTDIKSFDDVSYKWDVAIYDDTNKVHLDNGFNISSYSNSATFRFYTKLTIIDKKGNSYGKAVELAVKHELAYIGFYFADNSTIASETELGTSATGVYLPLFSGGVTTGEYVTGDEIPLQAHARSESVSDDTYKYDPSSGEGDTGDLTTRFIQTEMKDSTRMFGMTASEFSILTHWLNTGVIPEIQTETDYMQKFKNTNPADYVLSMRYYPFDLPVAYGLEVYVGPVQVLANNQPFTVTHIPRRIGPKRAADLGGQSLFDFGTVNVPIDNDFRINYTKMLLYVPWCGYAELDPKIFAYSQGGAPTRLNVKISIDFGTGSCMGIITRVNSNGDQTVIQTVNGSCGVDVPLFAVNHGEYAKTIKDLEVALQQAETARFTAGVGLVGSMIGTAAAAYSGNALGAFAGIGSMIGTAAGIENTNTKLDSIKYQIEHYAPSVSNISGASPFNNVLFEAMPKLYIYKPIMLPGYNKSVYGHTVGFACNRSGKLSDFNGLTVCASYDLSGIECTADEKQIISNYLKGGVIV